MKSENISNFCERDLHWEKTSMVRAMTECLDLVDLCQLLKSYFLYDSLGRDASLRALTSNQAFVQTSEYCELIDFFIQQIGTLKGRDSQAAGFCLVRLAQVCEEQVLERVIQSFLANKYVGSRRRGYKLARHASKPATLVSLIEKKWFELRDSEAARFLVEHAQPDFIIKQRQELVAAFSEMPWLIAKVYIVAARVDARTLDEIRGIDAITFMYVATKVGHTVSSEEAIDIFKRNLNSDRVGLLIWCLGKMRLERALIELSDRWEEFEAKQLENITERYSTADCEMYA